MTDMIIYNTFKFIGKHIKSWLRELTSLHRILLYAHKEETKEKMILVTLVLSSIQIFKYGFIYLSNSNSLKGSPPPI